MLEGDLAAMAPRTLGAIFFLMLAHAPTGACYEAPPPPQEKAQRQTEHRPGCPHAANDDQLAPLTAKGYATETASLISIAKGEGLTTGQTFQLSVPAIRALARRPGSVVVEVLREIHGGDYESLFRREADLSRAKLGDSEGLREVIDTLKQAEFDSEDRPRLGAGLFRSARGASFAQGTSR